MHENFKAISLSYKNAPLEIREMVSFDEAGCKKILALIHQYTDATEALVVSTCNRTEIYYAATEVLTDAIVKLISIAKDFEDYSGFRNFFEEYNEHGLAIRHLYNVSLGLEAQVVGDLQIINQVKNAYQWSADENMSGPFLHRLMHTIFFTNKRVVQETSFRDGAASVSYATVEAIAELTVALAKPKILILGLGEIGEYVARNLEHIKEKEVRICNRTHEVADQLALELGYSTVAFQDYEQAIDWADVIVSSVTVVKPIIGKEQIKKLDINSHKYLFDLSVPRSIEEDIEKIPGMLLYNIDDIQSKATIALQKRIEAIPHVEQIVEESASEFDNWTKEMEVSPTINKLKNALEEIRLAEIARHIKKMSPEESALMDTVTKNLMQKIIKLPVLQLKAACKRGEAESLIDVLNDLFDLEAQPDKVKK